MNDDGADEELQEERSFVEGTANGGLVRVKFGIFAPPTPTGAEILRIFGRLPRIEEVFDEE